MDLGKRSITILQSNRHLLSPDKRAIARYICENWPLKSRLPHGIAELAQSAFGFSVADLAASLSRPSRLGQRFSGRHYSF
jgi:hypothetical protein